VNYNFKNSILFQLNSKKTICKRLKIPFKYSTPDIDISHFYSFLYLKKKEKSNCMIKETKNLRHQSFVCSKNTSKQILTNRPSDFNSHRYRILVSINKEFEWLKKSQRLFHKHLVNYIDAPYLHSTVKNKSYATNALEHCGDASYIFSIDIRSFFTLVDRKKVAFTIMDILKVEKDVAAFYANLTTSPKDEPPHHNNEFNLGQGLPSSPILAFLANRDLFDYLYLYAKDNDVLMTLYVDDLTFSSKNEISQLFIDRIIGLIQRAGLLINRLKIKNSRVESVKKTTGVFISRGKPKIPSRKHEELNIQHSYLCKFLPTINDFELYFVAYNIYLRFMGNLQFLYQVECRSKDKTIQIPNKYRKYDMFTKDYGSFFPLGIAKTNKFEYSKNNIRRVSDYKKLKSAYLSLIKNQKK